MVQYTRASAVHYDSSGTDPSNARAVKSRRSHTKSRNGCTECKNRHIRCDERQPSCVNCEVAERICSFPPPKSGRQKQRQRQNCRAKQGKQPGAAAALSPESQRSSLSNFNNIDNTEPDSNAERAFFPTTSFHRQENRPDLGPAPDQSPYRSSPRHDITPSITGFDSNLHQYSSSTNVCTPIAHCHPDFTVVPNAVSEAVFTPQHMILLRYADTVPNFTGPNGSVVEIAVHHAVGSPYLIDEVLAFTAFHLAYMYPGSAVHLQKLATELQTRALTTFTRLTENIPKDDITTAVPRFLFSALLGRHFLAETLAHHHSDFRSFIDRFVECFNLNRGIRAVTPPARVCLYNSEIRFFLKVIIEAQDKITSPGHECDPLRHLIDDSDLNEASVEACRQAVDTLQQSFDTCRGLNEEDYPQTASGFLVGVSANFVDVLSKHRPEALVILAYYGVLLHRCRSFWAFGNAGASMIRTIAGNLGNYWQKALAWPLHMLEAECASDLVDAVPRNDTLMI